MHRKDLRQQLTMRVDEVLQYIWDPIGISGMPEARNEYDPYVFSVLGAVIEGKSKDEISAILTNITTEYMGL